MLRNLQTRNWLPLILILAARFILGLTYSFINPAWESYDEVGHFAYARYLAKHRTLQLQPGDPEAEEIWEKFQPPMYYLLVAPFIAGFDLGETFQVSNRNPYFLSGKGVNYAVHPDDVRPGEEPLMEKVLRVARAVSVMLSTASIVFAYLTFRRLWPTRPTRIWTATLLYAFWPQFLFVGSMVTNDALITALSAVLSYLMIRLASDGFRPGLILGLGFALAAGILTKLNAIAFILPTLAALFLGLCRYANRWKAPGTWIIALSLGLLLMALLWLLSSFKFVTAHVFNLTLILQFLSSLSELSPNQHLDRRLLLDAVYYSFRTFLAAFGWGNPETYRWLYRLGLLGAGVAFIGLVTATLKRWSALAAFSFRKSREPRAPGGVPEIPVLIRMYSVLGLQAVSVAGLLLGLAIARKDFFLMTGRYLLPALPAVICLLIGGWQALMPRQWQSYLWKSISLGIVLIGWSIPFETIAPAYAKPQPLKNIGAIEYPLHIFFNQEIELLGATRPPPVSPESNLDVSLCWQALTPITQNYSVFLEVVGPDGEGYGQLEMYPGRGNYPTSFWRVNQPFCDDYTFQVRGDVPSPSAAALRIALLAGVQGNPLGVTDSSGQVIPPDRVTLPLKIRADDRDLPSPSHPVNYYFGEGINLTGYDLETLSDDGTRVRVTLHWKALQDIRDNYIVFVHLRDAPDHLYAQDDTPPHQGWYPTSLWQSGEIIQDKHDLILIPQAVKPALDLYVGLYDPLTGVRLSVYDSQSNPLPNDEVSLSQGLVFP